MKPKNLTAACVIIAMSTMFASASFAIGPGEETPCERACNSQSKANNGWGNGIDGDNNGTDEGTAEQVGTKENDFVSEKFDGKFQGR